MEKKEKKHAQIHVSLELKKQLDDEIIKSGIKMSYSQLLKYLIEKNKKKDEYITSSK